MVAVVPPDKIFLGEFPANIEHSFLGKVIEQVVAFQLQRTLDADEADCLNAFQFGFRSGLRIEIVLITLTCIKD